MRPPSSFLSLLILGTLSTAALAHPIPDIPVKSAFDAAGTAVVIVEIDLRCFDSDPATAPYFLNEYLPGKPETWRAEQIAKAQAFVAQNVEFSFEPAGKVAPELKWEFTGLGNTPLTKIDDPVVLTGTWRTAVPAGQHGYRLRSTPENKLSVLFLNTLRGQTVERTQVLFPGESSFVLDLRGLANASPQATPAKGATLPWWRRWMGASVSAK